MVRAQDGTGRFTVVAQEPLDETRRFLDENHIQTSNVRSVPFATLGVSGTPTLLIVDSHGIVKRAFSGKLTPSNELAVVNWLRGPKGSEPTHIGS
jgi:hypothetical protein